MSLDARLHFSTCRWRCDTVYNGYYIRTYWYHTDTVLLLLCGFALRCADTIQGKQFGTLQYWSESWHPVQVRYFKPIGVDYHSLPVIRFGLVMCLLKVADMLVFAIFWPPFRLAFIARTGFLVMLPSVRRLGHCVTGRSFSSHFRSFYHPWMSGKIMVKPTAFFCSNGLYP